MRTNLLRPYSQQDLMQRSRLRYNLINSITKTHKKERQFQLNKAKKLSKKPRLTYSFAQLNIYFILFSLSKSIDTNLESILINN
jgi:hypothetical protein